MTNNIIPIAIVINNNYAMQASVVIASLIANKLDSTNYHIKIITDVFDEENSTKILSMQSNSVKIDIIQLGVKYNDLTNNTRWPNIIFYKFDVPFLFNDYEKVILLDADTIVLKDLTELYNTPLGDNYAGVVNDITMILKNDKFTKQIKHYFNIGVMLFNLKTIRKDFSPESFINCYKQNIDLFLSPEQDTLNYLFGDKIIHLHSKYQYITLYDNYLKSNFMKFHNIKDKKELEINNLVILHFAQMRPWKYFNLPYGKIWDDYFKQSLYYKKEKKSYYNFFFNLYRRVRYNYKFFKYTKLNGVEK